MKMFLDSSLVIEVLRKRVELKSSEEYFVSPIVYAEVGYGFLKIGKKLEELDRYLESKNIVVTKIDQKTIKIFTIYKFKLRQKPIEDNDLLIASSCIENGFGLWTLNKKHFSRVKGLKVQ